MGRFRLDPTLVVHELGEIALDRPRNAVAACRLGGEHDLERVIGVLRPRDCRPARLDAVDEVPEADGPLPVRFALRMDAPGAFVVAPELPALGRPVLPEEPNRALLAVQLERGRAVLFPRRA